MMGVIKMYSNLKFLSHDDICYWITGRIIRQIKKLKGGLSPPFNCLYNLLH